MTILDDKQFAINTIEKNTNESQKPHTVLSTYHLIAFIKVLKQEGLEKMDVIGTDFDTDYHEAHY